MNPLKFTRMRRFNVRRSYLVISDGRMVLYLVLDHVTIFIRLRSCMQNMRYGQRIRSAMLEEKVIYSMTGINEYHGRAALFR